MSTCQFKKGFFLLQQCSAPATQVCNQCTLPVCMAHGRFIDERFVCSTCAAQLEPPAAGRKSRLEDWERDSYYYRSHYYAHSSYRPYAYADFDDTDVAAFNQSSGGELKAEDDSDPVGFGDS